MSEITKLDPKPLMVAEELAMMREQAAILVKSQFLPPHIKTAEQALAIMLKARELDIPPMMAIDQLYVVKGRVTCQGSLIMALIMRSGLLEDYKILNEEDSVTITMTRTHPRITREAVWTKDRAIKSGLTKEYDHDKKVFKDKPTYTRFLMEMLKWRAVAEIAREIFSDVTGNIYLREEIETSEILGAQAEVETAGAPQVLKVVAKMDDIHVPVVPGPLAVTPSLPPPSPPTGTSAPVNITFAEDSVTGALYGPPPPPPPPPARRKPGKQATLLTDKLALPVEIEALIDHADTSEGLAALRFTEGDAMEEAGLGPLFFQAIEKRLKEL